MGWTTFAANPNSPVVSAAIPAGGTQHLRITRGPGSAGSFNGAFSPDLGDFADKGSVTSFDVMMNTPNGADAHMVGQAPGQAFLTWRVNFSFFGTINILDDADGIPGGTLAFINTGFNWVPGQYRNMRIEFDFSGGGAGTLRYFYNNALIYTGSVGHYAGTAVEQVILFSDNLYNTPSEFIDYDNLNWTPDPTTLALLGLGAVALRRRR